MEFVEGETLQNLIKRSGRLEVKLALEIATQVASGLAAVHKQSSFTGTSNQATSW
jgi:serine/threonine protein kinase